MASLASESIIVGEDWISEHYLTTDAKSQSFQARVLERRKAWDYTDQSGGTSVRARFTARRTALATRLAGLCHDDDPDELHGLYAELTALLGYTEGRFAMHRQGPLRTVGLDDLTGVAPLAVIEARPVDQVDDLLTKDAATLLEPILLDATDAPIVSVARLLSTLFVDEARAFALVLAGKWLLIAERERWPEGRWLAIDLQLVCDWADLKRGGEIDRALACIDADSLAPNADGDIWWSSVLDDSIKHTVGVSQDLREGVRRSIEIIANDVVRRRERLGLPKLAKDQAQPLAQQSLRFLYRILFLLYAEASPELQVLPVGAAEYQNGYSLDRLRELTLVELATDAGRSGTHFFDSLGVLFRMVDRGHSGGAPRESSLQPGLEFNSLRADLFRTEAMPLIEETKLSDAELQRVLQYLLLSREQRGRDRGFISYADLGINQLGAVYEGLMSYTGFFAEQPLYEVAKEGNPEKGSWVVPVSRALGIEPQHFVTALDPVTGERKPVLHDQGTFVFRLAGRERQQSASYYTPEVLTRFVVSQALEELLDQSDTITTAAEILQLTVCEPALGSGAFAIEAVRQLASEYLKRRQMELGQTIDPDRYAEELQKVKASIALHQVYGVDLNKTAVEFAEITLWLDTMSAGLQAPWFGLHLRRGNSLIGARRAVYSRADIASKAWLTAVPRDVSVAELSGNPDGQSVTAGGVHHFLLPAAGWGSATDAKEAKELAPERLALLKQWRASMKAKPSKVQTDRLVALSARVEVLWRFALRRLEIAEQQIRRTIPLWGGEAEVSAPTDDLVSREEIERSLAAADGAYQRLRRVMDAWAALWFWPLTDGLTGGSPPPTLDQWISGLTALLGEHTMVSPARAKRGGVTLGASRTGWVALNDEERDDLAFASVQSVADVLAANPWLRACERIADQQGFFHWELDFATVFARGGFDLQVGNPPWVRPRSDVDALLAEGDPWWQLAVKPTQEQIAAKRAATLGIPGIRGLLIDGTIDVAATAAFVGDSATYPHLAGLQPDLYRCFMEQTWRHGSGRGITGMIHPETHFTDEKAGILRAAAYPRLRRHWQFINELRLFEIHNLVTFGVHVYGSILGVSFKMAASLYHPDTLVRSLMHDGSGPEPGLKDPDGHWDVRPHRNRIIAVTDEALVAWHAVLEEASVPVSQTRMVYAVNRATATVLNKLSNSRRIKELHLEFSSGWHEKNDRTKGYFDVEWGPVASWRDAILQGPHLFVANPFYKSPNASMLSNKDWSTVDLETLAPDALPVTAYKPAKPAAEYDAAYTHWGDDHIPARDHYRVAWRNMAANGNERTLIATIVPPGAAHVHGIASARLQNDRDLVRVTGMLSSLLADFAVRSAPKSTISPSTLGRLPLSSGVLLEALIARTLRLNAVTSAFADLWESTYSQPEIASGWAGGLEYAGRRALDEVESHWSIDSPLRRASDRRQALVEIDAIVALVLGLTADELCTIYRTQFAVLYGYDRTTYFYDANGRLVPNSVLTTWRAKGERIPLEERTATNPSGNTYVYELPFRTLDREADMRQAYAHFERILAAQS